MSYSELDAWIDEKARDNWPFDRWDIGLLSLRINHDYCGNVFFEGSVSGLNYRLRRAFGQEKTNTDLKKVLDCIIETVNVAIDHEESEAQSNWLNSELWLPIIDENRHGADEPVEMLVDSLNIVDCPDEYSDQELFAALGLWLLGEWHHYDKQRDVRLQYWAMTQIAIAIAEAEWHRGKLESVITNQKNLARRNKDAANKRHEANRIRKKAAQNWYMSLDRGSIKQADAARKISSDYLITFEVAKRWAAEFERSRNTLK